jgi:hypothetical protein
MMQATDHREGDDVSLIGGIALAELGGVLVECEVGPGAVIVLEVLPQDAPQVLLCENDDVVEALPCADGPSVTLKCTTRRRSCSSTRNTYRTRNVAVGTTKKSMETRSRVWFWRKARHLCEGGFRRRGMYRDTVACATCKPSMSNSP